MLLKIWTNFGVDVYFCLPRMDEESLLDVFLGKVSKGANIRNRYNQVPHLTQDTNGKVTNSQLDTTNESQEVSPLPAGDHKAQINRRAQRHNKQVTEKNIKDPQKKYHLGTVSKIFWLESFNQFRNANLALNSDVDQDRSIYHLSLIMYLLYNTWRAKTTFYKIVAGSLHWLLCGVHGEAL